MKAEPKNTNSVYCNFELIAAPIFWRLSASEIPAGGPAQAVNKKTLENQQRRLRLSAESGHYFV
jgi:hypothetical protein